MYSAKFILLFLMITLTACAPTTQIIRTSTTGLEKVKGINILFLNAPMSSPRKNDADLGDYSKYSPEQEELRNTIVDKLPKLFSNKGIPCAISSVEFIPGVASRPMHELFPAGSLNRHLLVVSPLSAHKYCHGLTCVTQFKVSLSLRIPQTNQEVWQAHMQQPNEFMSLQLKSRYVDFASEMSRVIMTAIVLD